MNIWGRKLLHSIDRIDYAMTLYQRTMDAELLGNIREAVSAVSFLVYENRQSESTEEFCRCAADEAKAAYSKWYGEVRSDLSRLMIYTVELDREFERLMIVATRCSEGSFLKQQREFLAAFKKQQESGYHILLTFYQRYEHLWGGYDPDRGNYEHIINGIKEVREHTAEFRWLYERLADYRSKKVLYGILRFWLYLDFSYKESIRENNYDDYFDLDILRGRMSEDEVFVDCGAYDGDTAESYLKNFSVYTRMYLYEMVPVNMEKAMERLAEYEECVFRNVGAGSREQSGKTIRVKNMNSSAVSVQGEGTVAPDDEKAEEVETLLVTLDDDIKESISFLKMDIEGAEIDALKGAMRHIKEEKPKLAICTYHHYSHLWEIPRLIDAMRQDYTFYLRYQGVEHAAMAMEHYLMAV